jgi:phosphatidylglycerophosphate synthase
MAIAAWLGASPILIFWIVIAASASDYFDGWLARRLKRASYEGKILDFVADNIFLSLSFLVFARAGVLDVTVAAILASYCLVVLLGTTVVSWGAGKPLVAVPTGERLVLLFGYVVACSAAGRFALPGKAVYSTILWMSSIVSVASVAFGVIGYFRIARRLLLRFGR